MWSFRGVGGRKISPIKQADDTLLHHGQLQCHQRIHGWRRLTGYPLVICFLCSFPHWLLSFYQHMPVVEICATEKWWLEPESVIGFQSALVGAFVGPAAEMCGRPTRLFHNSWKAKAALRSYPL